MKSRTQEERGLRIALEQERITQEEFDVKMSQLRERESGGAAVATAPEPPKRRSPQYVMHPHFLR